jgi:hypothetical protein
MEQIKSISQINIGEFVEFQCKCEGESLSYFGQVLKSNPEDDYFEMQTYYGIMGFFVAKCYAADQHFKLFKAEEPKEWKKYKTDRDAFMVKLYAKDKGSKTKSTKTLVTELVRKNKKSNEATLLKLAKEKIGGDDNLLIGQIRLALTKLNKQE